LFVVRLATIYRTSDRHSYAKREVVSRRRRTAIAERIQHCGKITTHHSAELSAKRQFVSSVRRPDEGGRPCNVERGTLESRTELAAVNEIVCAEVVEVLADAARDVNFPAFFEAAKRYSSEAR
jgi:hypothetical protein